MSPFFRVTLGYLIFGITWIFTSDYLVELVAADLSDISHFQTLKGLVFVLLSALLICALTRRALERERTQQAEKTAVYRKAVEGAHHILLNYLNNMQVVTLEAEDCPGFKPETLRLAREVSAKAEIELRRLEEIQTITPEQIDSVIYRDLR